MKKFRNIKALILILLVIVGGGYLLSQTQTTIYNYFNPPEAVDITALHPNNEAYERKIDFGEDESKRNYQITDFVKEVTSEEYKEVEFTNISIENERETIVDITFIGIVFLIVMISLIIISYRLLNNYLK